MLTSRRKTIAEDARRRQLDQPAYATLIFLWEDSRTRTRKWLRLREKKLGDGTKILVAYDGSDHAHRALIEAIGIAEKYSGSVTVLNVYSKEKIRSRDLLKKAGAFARMRNVKCDAKSERSENVPARIIEIARDGAYDLIAIGSRGVGGAKAWLLGSVSSRVAAEAHCPVLIVK